MILRLLLPCLAQLKLLDNGGYQLEMPILRRYPGLPKRRRP